MAKKKGQTIHLRQNHTQNKPCLLLFRNGLQTNNGPDNTSKGWPKHDAASTTTYFEPRLIDEPPPKCVQWGHASEKDEVFLVPCPLHKELSAESTTQSIHTHKHHLPYTRPKCARAHTHCYGRRNLGYSPFGHTVYVIRHVPHNAADGRRQTANGKRQTADTLGPG